MATHAMLSNYISRRYHVNFEQKWSKYQPLRDSIISSFYLLMSNYARNVTQSFALFFLQTQTSVTILLSHAGIERTVTSKVTSLQFLPAGDRYVVVDCGGGTVDLTVHQIRLPEGHLKELYKASGKQKRVPHTADVTIFM